MEKLLKHPVIFLIGLFSSIITIYVFVSGVSNLKDIFPHSVKQTPKISRLKNPTSTDSASIKMNGAENIMNSGKIIREVYSNSKFRFSIKIPSECDVNNKALSRDFFSREKCLLTIAKYDQDTLSGILISGFDTLGVVPNVKNGLDYLKMLGSYAENSDSTLSITSPTIVRINGNIMYEMSFYNFKTYAIRNVYATVIDRYILLFITGCKDKHVLTYLDNIIKQSLHFYDNLETTQGLLSH